MKIISGWIKHLFPRKKTTRIPYSSFQIYSSVKLIAGEDLSGGDFVYIKNGQPVTHARAYSRTERMVRKIGALIRSRRMAKWHERLPVGIAVKTTGKGNMAEIAVQGSFKVKMHKGDDWSKIYRE